MSYDALTEREDMERIFEEARIKREQKEEEQRQRSS